MKLIAEFNDTIAPIITESTNGKKDYFIEGVFMQADIKNRNGRVYPKEIMEKEVGRYRSKSSFRSNVLSVSWDTLKGQPSISTKYHILSNHLTLEGSELCW